MASLLKSLEPSVGWRRHEILPDLEESPVPDRFRKKPSLDLRRSLRKRMPLRDAEINLDENPTWESLEAKEKRRNLKRTAKNVLGTVSQKIQDSCQGPARSLVASLAKIPSGSVRHVAKNRALKPRTPRRRSIRRAMVLTPGSGAKMVSPFGEEMHRRQENLLPLRRSTRTSALRSPYGSPISISQRKRFDRDSERVSSGIRRLKRLSQAFNDIILQEESDMTVSLIRN
ncbi:protein PIMREG isoform X1 [Sceloporus undulatus]|uniref:protein PIMREG isoform X1 n=1 Tax=Sceloporus undulatus TaxID=8520 RepID=UPI001C4C4EEF|nr:protein PIMREG isoform X1 [Sceloporus undulatus]